METQGNFSFCNDRFDKKTKRFIQSFKFRHSGNEIPRYLLASLVNLTPSLPYTGKILDKLGYPLGFAFLLGARNLARSRFIWDPELAWTIYSQNEYRQKGIAIGDRQIIFDFHNDDFVSLSPSKKVVALIIDGHQYPSIQEFTGYSGIDIKKGSTKIYRLSPSLEEAIAQVSQNIRGEYHRLLNTVEVDITWEEELSGGKFCPDYINKRITPNLERKYHEAIRAGLNERL